MLKIITPNFFRMGRNNNRALDGPVKLPAHGGELIDKVNEAYQSIFRLWCDTYVPRLVYQPSKWNRDDVILHKGDLVYFKKEPDKKLSSKWVIGMVEEILQGRDKKNRKVIVKYVNEGENRPQTTERAIRTLIKIYNVEEYMLQEDLAEVMERLVRNPIEVVDEQIFPIDVAEVSVDEGDTLQGTAFTTCSSFRFDDVHIACAVNYLGAKMGEAFQLGVSYQSICNLIDHSVDNTAADSSSSECGLVHMIRRTDLILE